MSIFTTYYRRSTAHLTSGVLAAASLAGALIWVFWPTLTVMADQWGNDPRYSHGYLVPLFSLYLLWSKRGTLETAACRPSWFGLLFLLAGFLLRFAGIYLYYEWIAAMALLPCLAGLSLLIGGWAALRWSWPAIAFLAFMAPLPYWFESALAHPLQRFATIVSAYSLQTLGFIAVAEGNTIRMGEVRLAVAEACSGLSMLVIFFALSTAVAIVIRRPLYEKLLVFISAIPIALLVNVTRIVVTGVLKKMVSEEVGDRVFHDLAGWLMMPLALALMWLVLRLSSWLLKDPPAREVRPYVLFSPIAEKAQAQ
jgi:exosortase